MRRCELTPEKLEIVGRRLLDTDEQRLLVLGMLLESLGADAAARLGDPKVWRDTVVALDR